MYDIAAVLLLIVTIMFNELSLPPSSFPDIGYILSANTISTVANVQNRLVFDEQNSTQVNRTLSFSSPGTEITDTVTVYARVSFRTSTQSEGHV